MPAGDPWVPHQTAHGGYWWRIDPSGLLLVTREVAPRSWLWRAYRPDGERVAGGFSPTYDDACNSAEAVAP